MKSPARLNPSRSWRRLTPALLLAALALAGVSRPLPAAAATAAAPPKSTKTPPK